MKYLLFIVVFFSFLPEISGQTIDSRNGYNVPVHDSVRVLVIFAEVDYSAGGCPGGFNEPLFPPNSIPGGHNQWGVDGSGNTMIPSDADDLFDVHLPAVGPGLKILTNIWFINNLTLYLF